jgi:hypothetical protein
MLIALERGQATAQVPESDVGFTIKTANVHIIDQGAQFGVAAEDGKTDVIVFQGKVDLQNQIRTAAPQQRLVSGEAVTVDVTGAANRFMQIGQNAEGDWWTGPRGGVDNTIEEVRDNVGSTWSRWPHGRSPGYVRRRGDAARIVMSRRQIGNLAESPASESRELSHLASTNVLDR